MQELVELVENEARVSHRVVAQSTNNDQKNIAELIRRYHDGFEEFGTPTFKTEGVANNGKGEQPKTYYLNEPQATFLMTLLRNKPIVVEFKKKLVKAFYELKEEKYPQSETDLSNILMTMVKNQSRQTDALIDLTSSVVKLINKKEGSEEIIFIPPKQQTKISRDEKMNIRSSIESKAKEISEGLGITKKSIAPGMWIEFKNFFDVDDYGDINPSQYGAALNWIMMYEPRSKAQTYMPEIRI